ncbi:dihydropteroate synthase [Arachidicoccus terrestris]|uniref:dihydropteroate synthase n=1 Tax=Arachidicoccus terrestris TaxID=2875539 RepID=UPI001CC3865D|nr:dihydropteroate synthase [Arachidicoccus terrestris]UAY53762.1 dihydropteroate synthase [Arachidicoccus terrestris]
MFTLNCKGRLLTLQKPAIMGIINVNQDSFFAGSREADPSAVAETASRMLEAGAAYIDLGGQSTHPKSPRIGAAAEMNRVVPAIKAILERHPDAVISVDTYFSEVAGAAVQAGALMVNDISAGNLDTNMLSTVGELEVPYIAMHMRGNPNTMSTLTDYEDVVLSVFDYFVTKAEACKEAGIKDIILDPGFGFAKTQVQNYNLLSRLDAFKVLEKPILVGVSRKSMIYKFLGITADEALNASTVLHTYALERGAHILRVHDVEAAIEAVRLLAMLDECRS